MNHKTDYAARGQALRTQQRLASGQRAKLYLAMLASGTALGAVAAPSQLMDEAIMPHAIDYWQAATLEATIGEINPRVTTSVERENGPIKVPVSRVTAHPTYQGYGDALLNWAFLGAFGGFSLGIGGCLAVHRSLAAAGRKASEDKVIGGTRVVSEKELAKRVAKQAKPDALKLASVPIPSRMPTRHFAFAGVTGSGKSTALRQMLDVIDARGEPALVYDTSGEFVEHYYRPERGDIILNTFDARGCWWSPFSEIRRRSDTDRLARQLVSKSGNRENDVWLETTRILVGSILWRLYQQGRTDLPTLIDVLQTMTAEQLAKLVERTPAARTFAEGADKATGSVLFMLTRVAQLLQYLIAEPDEEAKPFSFRDYVGGLDECEGAKPWVFVTRKEDEFDAMRPLMACWLDCAATATLALTPSNTRRLWFMLDEFPDLPKVDNIARLLPQGRKFGAAVVLALQSIGQMQERYGREGAEALLGNCNTKLFLQLGDQATRQWASQSIGQEEVEIRTQSDTLAIDPDKAQASLGTTRQRRAAVIESAFKLPPFEGYLQLPDGHPVARVKLTNDHILERGKAKHEGYIPGDEARLLFSHQPQAPDSSLLDDGIV